MVAVGLRTAVGIADETTYGTWVSPTAWTEVLSETLERRNMTKNSAGLRGGVRAPSRGSRRVLTGHEAGGDVTFELAQVGMGKWVKHLLGAPTSAQQGGTAAYLHTFGMTTLPTGFSVQKLVRDHTGATVATFSYSGGKMLGAEFAANSQSDMLTARFSADFQKESTADAAGTPSHPSTGIFHGGQVAITLGGTGRTQVLSASVSVGNQLKTDRRPLGNAGLKLAPVDNDWPQVSGRLTAEFENLTDFYNAFAADTSQALVITAVGDLIASTFFETFKITIPDVRLEGSTPKINGPDLVVADVPFVGLWDGTLAGITIEITDTSTTY